MTTSIIPLSKGGFKMTLRYLCSFLFVFLVALPAFGQELIAPSPTIEPRKVVEIQLQSLQHNDDPAPDFGIAQTWAFAHPSNKRMTGPLERFAQMIKGPNYRNMINHKTHKIEPVVATEERALFAVSLKTADGQAMAFQWEVHKVREGVHAGSWMTTTVSPPLRDGDAT